MYEEDVILVFHFLFHGLDAPFTPISRSSVLSCMSASSFVRILFKLLVLIMVLSFLYTGVYDPGVIRSTEENSLLGEVY